MKEVIFTPIHSGHQHEYEGRVANKYVVNIHFSVPRCTHELTVMENRNGIWTLVVLNKKTCSTSIDIGNTAVKEKIRDFVRKAFKTATVFE